MYSPLTVLWHWAERKLKWYPVLSGNCSHHEQSKSYSYNKTLSCFIQIFLSFWCVWAFGSTKLVLEKTVSAWQGRVCLCEAAVCICVYVVTVCLKLCLPGKKKKKSRKQFPKIITLHRREGIEMLFRITAMTFDRCSVIVFQVFRTPKVQKPNRNAVMNLAVACLLAFFSPAKPDEKKENVCCAQLLPQH